MLDYRKITIQTHAQLKRDVDQHSFDCQEIRVANTRTYVLCVAEQDLADIAPGCKLLDSGKEYRVRKILFWPSPGYAFITAN